MKYLAHKNFSRDEAVSIGSEAIISLVKCGNHTDTDKRGVTVGELLALGVTHDEAVWRDFGRPRRREAAGGQFIGNLRPRPAALRSQPEAATKISVTKISVT
jgi:hypothetical protein